MARLIYHPFRVCIGGLLLYYNHFIPLGFFPVRRNVKTESSFVKDQARRADRIIEKEKVRD